jgi:hypothetical protein
VAQGRSRWVSAMYRAIAASILAIVTSWLMPGLASSDPVEFTYEAPSLEFTHEAPSLEFTYDGPGPLEVQREADSEHCPSISTLGTDVNGGCLIHLVSQGEIRIRTHNMFGVEFELGLFNCNHELQARLGEDGQGYAFEQVLAGPDCVRQACKGGGAEAIPWAVSSREVGNGAEEATLSMCLERPDVGGPETCEFDLPIRDAGPDHDYVLGSSSEMPAHLSSSFKCEVIGHWDMEVGGTHDGQAEEQVELAHVN